MPELFEPLSYSRRKEASLRRIHDERLWKLGVVAYEKENGHLVRAATDLLDTVVQDLDLVDALCRYFIEFRIGPAVAADKPAPRKGKDATKAEGVQDQKPGESATQKPTLADQGAVHSRAAIKRDPLPKKKPVGQPRGREAIAMANADLWNYKVRGYAIGSLTLGDARRMIETNDRESNLLRALCDHVAGHADPSKPLSDLIKVSVLKAALDKFSKGNNHA